MHDVLGVLALAGDSDSLLAPEVSMGLEHARLAVEYERVAESGDVHLVPGLAKHDVALQDLVLEGRSEAALAGPLFDVLLDLAADAADRPDLGPGELGHLKLAVEHALDEGGVLVDLEGLADELELLHDLELTVHLDHGPRHADAEVTHILAVGVLELLHSNKGGANRIGWPVEGGVAKAEFGGVFDLPEPLGLHIIRAVHGDSLELPPADG